MYKKFAVLSLLPFFWVIRYLSQCTKSSAVLSLLPFFWVVWYLSQCTKSSAVLSLLPFFWVIRYLSQCTKSSAVLSLLPFFWVDNKVIHKVRQTTHKNPEFEFGPTQGEIKKKPAKKYNSIQGGGGRETQKTINFGGKLSFIVSFLFLEPLHCCYICFHALTCTTTIISLEPCVLNAEF
jgi:hypothetical protein